MKATITDIQACSSTRFGFKCYTELI